MDRAPEVSADHLTGAIALREVLFTVIAREIDDAAPRLTGAERTMINAAAAVSPPTPALSSDGVVQRNGEVAAGLSAVARDAIAPFDRRDGSVLKWCADDNCTHPFLDSSHGHRRRWCGMAGCGDRAKAAAYRARKGWVR